MGNIDVDPEYVDPTGLDGVAGTPDDNLHLYANSPCIDSADNSAVAVATDLAGNLRKHAATPPNPAVVDMGAYEFQCIKVEAPTLDPNWIDAGYGTRNRYLSFSAPAADVNISVEIIKSPSYPSTEGLRLWVGQPAEVCENAAQGPGVPATSCVSVPGLPKTFMASSLLCAPLPRDWSSFDVVHVYDDEIVPSSGQSGNSSSFNPASYKIQSIDATCDPSIEENYSAPVLVTTSKWGDACGCIVDNVWQPPNGIIDILDMVCILNKYSENGQVLRKVSADIDPKIPDRKVNLVGDLTMCQTAFQGSPYTTLGWVPDGCP